MNIIQMKCFKFLTNQSSNNLKIKYNIQIFIIQGNNL